MMMFAIDNADPDTAEIFLAIGVILGLLAALLYAIGTRPVRHVDGDHPRVNVALWAPVCLSAAVASIALAWWVA
jgi:hypothetical protein